MKTNKMGILLLVILTVSFVLNIFGYLRSSERSSDFNKTIDSLVLKNRYLESSIDSIDSLLIIEMSRYDSLKMKIDSSEYRYDDIKSKYDKMKDSIRYLDADESIIFLIKEAGL